jgi:hypothetical protein
MAPPDNELHRAVRLVAPTSRNPVRIPQVTCRVCTTASPGYDLCARCSQHVKQATRGGQTTSPLADRVVPLRYAIRGQQSYIDAWAYKNPDTPPERNHAMQRMKVMTYLFTKRHAACLDKVSTSPVSAVALVPSLSHPDQPHALEQVARYLPRHWTRIGVSPATTLPADRDLRRELNPSFMVVDDPTALTDQHVVVFDDTWTTGGHAQSLTIALRQAGAREVSIVIIGRDLNPQHPPTAELLRTHVNSNPYNIDLCPVTGSTCPT